MLETWIQFISCGLAILTILAYFIYNSYRQSIKPSKYMLAAQKLGFKGYEKSNGQKISMEEQQEALLKIFQLAGYFKLSNIWHDLNCIGDVENVTKVFDEISSVVKYSKADQSDPTKFNAKYMRTNLFKSDNIHLQDALDLLLYIAQHAFGRQAAQERYELVSPKWMTTYADYYLEAARLLRLIDREYPTLNVYDSCWIAGAARVALSQRIIDYKYYIYSKAIKINGETLVLAGEREVWANIDGMTPTLCQKLLEASEKNIDINTVRLSSSADDDSIEIEEGKAYIMHLARFYNIKLNASKPFIQYASKDECPPGRFPNRIYANYDDMNKTSKLTETHISQDLLRTYLDNNINKINIIDTLAQDKVRPNTASTARDATERIIKRIHAGEYGDKKIIKILLYTNNPFIERQTLVTQRQVNQILEKYGLTAMGYQIKIEGVGFSSQQRLAIVHSELGALITEKYKDAIVDIEATLEKRPKRDITRLLFQTRDKNLVVPDQPNIKNNSDDDLI
ncbi:unnamed protein product [Rotaria sordida]|uniref:Uncharacterized protein n=1 Tax=Rotaria sordida TaxID=392033 RepID=A0A819HEC5_9BILA|nr:unnamed protein product [Rotaria sordida]